MQSIVQPTAMNTNENLLICGTFSFMLTKAAIDDLLAPTGAVSVMTVGSP